MDITQEVAAYCKADIVANKRMIESLDPETEWEEILILRSIIHDEAQIFEMCQEELNGKEERD